jgi:hypothetical protein
VEKRFYKALLEIGARCEVRAGRCSCCRVPGIFLTVAIGPLKIDKPRLASTDDLLSLNHLLKKSTITITATLRIYLNSLYN